MPVREYVDVNDAVPEPEQTSQMPVITEIRITPAKGEMVSTFRGFASITFNHCLVVRSLKINHGRYGLFVSWPKVKSNADGEWYGIAFPITRNLWKYVQDAVLKAYKEGGYAN